MSQPHPTAPSLGLIRHGSTAWSLAGRYQGRADLPLCTAGVTEARALAQKLAGRSISAVATSPLRRAQETALYLAEAGLPSVQIDEDLVELDYGAWEGKTQAELKAICPDQVRAWKCQPEHFTFPGGEALMDMQKRVQRCLARWRNAAIDQPVLLVTHSAWMRLACLAHSQQSLSQFRSMQIPTATVLWLSSMRPNRNPNEARGKEWPGIVA